MELPVPLEAFRFFLELDSLPVSCNQISSGGYADHVYDDSDLKNRVCFYYIIIFCMLSHVIRFWIPKVGVSIFELQPDTQKSVPVFYF